MVAHLRKQKSWNRKRWIGAVLFGAGVFQLYDGIIQHKVFRLHQIRYDVEIFYYDLVWNIGAVLFIIIGLLILRRKRVNSA